jgi:hypothetical protein
MIQLKTLFGSKEIYTCVRIDDDKQRISFLRSTLKAEVLRKAADGLDKVPLSLFWWL